MFNDPAPPEIDTYCNTLSLHDALPISSRVKVSARSSLRPDLQSVSEILAMTGQVIEIRLSAPRPNFLQILAQPQMGISGKNGGAGPYLRERRGKAWLLTPVRDESDSGEEETPADRKSVGEGKR